MTGSGETIDPQEEVPPEPQIPASGTDPGASGPDAEELSLAEAAETESGRDSWDRYGAAIAIQVDLKHPAIREQARILTERMQTQTQLLAIGRDCGAPVREIACMAAFFHADAMTSGRPEVFVVKLDEDTFDEDEWQRPQKIEDLVDMLKVLPSTAGGGSSGSILCVEFSLDEPPGFARSVFDLVDRAGDASSLTQSGQQIIFVLNLRAQDRLPPSVQETRPGILVLEWVKPLLQYYNEKWRLSEQAISDAAAKLHDTFIGRPEREAVLYSTIHALRGRLFPYGDSEFQQCIEEAIEESKQSLKAIEDLGKRFGSGNPIEQAILALAAFGPTMPHRTFASLGAKFLPEGEMPIRFLPEQVRPTVEGGTPGSSAITWAEAWRDHLDHYRSELKVTVRNQEIDLTVNRDALRDHLLRYPAALEKILEAIPRLLSRPIDRTSEETAIRLLIRLAATDKRSYDRPWHTAKLLELARSESGTIHPSAVFRLSTALRALDEQTDDVRASLAAQVFDDVSRPLLRRQGFSTILELCKRLDEERFRTHAVLERIVQNCSVGEFRSLLDAIAVRRGRLTPKLHLRLMLSSGNHLLPAEAYRSNVGESKARRALWLWNLGLRSDCAPWDIPYQKIILGHGLCGELFVGPRENTARLLRAFFSFDPVALVFASRNWKDPRRWLEHIVTVGLRATDAGTNALVIANRDALVQQVALCVLMPLFAGRSMGTAQAFSSLDELEPLALWQDVYAEAHGAVPVPAKDFARHLLRLLSIARSALVAEWLLQLQFSTHLLPEEEAARLREGAVALIAQESCDSNAGADLGEHLDYLAGIAEYLARWAARSVEDDRLSRMYETKRRSLEAFTEGLRTATARKTD